jgi:hypothetical protein
MVSRSAALEKSFITVLRNITTNNLDLIIASYALNVSTLPSSPNTVLPAWRDALRFPHLPTLGFYCTCQVHEEPTAQDQRGDYVTSVISGQWGVPERRRLCDLEVE